MMNSGVKGREKFLSIKNGQKFSTKYMASDDFSEPPRRADSKNPIFIFFLDFWVRVTSEARGSVSVGFWGVPSIEPFLGRGGSSQGALSTPPPFQLKACLPHTFRNSASQCFCSMHRGTRSFGLRASPPPLKGAFGALSFKKSTNIGYSRSCGTEGAGRGIRCTRAQHNHVYDAFMCIACCLEWAMCCSLCFTVKRMIKPSHLHQLCDPKATRNMLRWEGEGGGFRAPGWGVGGGSEYGHPSRRASAVCAHPLLMGGNFFFEKAPPPPPLCMFKRISESNGDHLEVRMLGGTHRAPPPKPRGALSDPPQA